jgi:hypothetical protein
MNIDYVVQTFGLTVPEAVRKARATVQWLYTEIQQAPVIPKAVLDKAIGVDSSESAAKLVQEARKALAGYTPPPLHSLAGYQDPLQPLLNAAQDAVGAAQRAALPEYRAQILARLTAKVDGLLTRVGGMDAATAQGHGQGARAQSEYLYAQEEVRAVRDLFNALTFALEVAPLGVLDWHQGSPQGEPASWFAVLTDLSPDKAGFETACKLGGFAGQSPEHWHAFLTEAREHDVTVKVSATVEEITAKVEAWHQVSETHTWNPGRQALFPKAPVRPVSPQRVVEAVARERDRQAAI